MRDRSQLGSLHYKSKALVQKTTATSARESKSSVAAMFVVSGHWQLTSLPVATLVAAVPV
jgi:hypothetical protein